MNFPQKFNPIRICLVEGLSDKEVGKRLEKLKYFNMLNIEYYLSELVVFSRIKIKNKRVRLMYFNVLFESLKFLIEHKLYYLYEAVKSIHRNFSRYYRLGGQDNLVSKINMSLNFIKTGYTDLMSKNYYIDSNGNIKSSNLTEHISLGLKICGVVFFVTLFYIAQLLDTSLYFNGVIFSIGCALIILHLLLEKALIELKAKNPVYDKVLALYVSDYIHCDKTGASITLEIIRLKKSLSRNISSPEDILKALTSIIKQMTIKESNKKDIERLLNQLWSRGVEIEAAESLLESKQILSDKDSNLSFNTFKNELVENSIDNQYFVLFVTVFSVAIRLKFEIVGLIMIITLLQTSYYIRRGNQRRKTNV